MNGVMDLLGGAFGGTPDLTSALFGPRSLQHIEADVADLRRQLLFQSLRLPFVPEPSTPPLWTMADYDACVEAGYVPPDLRIWKRQEDVKAYAEWQRRKGEIERDVANMSVAERAHLRHVLDTRY